MTIDAEMDEIIEVEVTLVLDIIKGFLKNLFLGEDISNKDIIVEKIIY